MMKPDRTMNPQQAIGYILALAELESIPNRSLWQIVDLLEDLARKADELDNQKRAGMVPMPPPPCEIVAYGAGELVKDSELGEKVHAWTKVVNTFVPVVKKEIVQG
jgi:hypothetical protein